MVVDGFRLINAKQSAQNTKGMNQANMDDENWQDMGDVT